MACSHAAFFFAGAFPIAFHLWFRRIPADFVYSVGVPACMRWPAVETRASHLRAHVSLLYAGAPSQASSRAWKSCSFDMPQDKGRCRQGQPHAVRHNITTSHSSNRVPASSTVPLAKWKNSIEFIRYIHIRTYIFCEICWIVFFCTFCYQNPISYSGLAYIP